MQRQKLKSKKKGICVAEESIQGGNEKLENQLKQSKISLTKIQKAQLMIDMGLSCKHCLSTELKELQKVFLYSIFCFLKFQFIFVFAQDRYSVIFPPYFFLIIDSFDCFTYPVLNEPKFDPRRPFTTSPPCFKKYQFICPSNSITLLHWFEFIKVLSLLEFCSFLESFMLAFVFLNSSQLTVNSKQFFCQFFNLFKVIFLS